MKTTLKKININKIPLGTHIDIRVSIDTLNLEFYSIGDYIKVDNQYYKVICK